MDLQPRLRLILIFILTTANLPSSPNQTISRNDWAVIRKCKGFHSITLPSLFFYSYGTFISLLLSFFFLCIFVSHLEGACSIVSSQNLIFLGPCTYVLS